MTDTKRPLKVFLCHAHADRDAVKALYDRLTNDGVDAWLDKERLIPGQDWELEIRKAVREADVVVVCLSKQFKQAGYRQREVKWVLNEAELQPEGEIFIIPARLEECDTLESLRKWHWVDLFEKGGYNLLIRALRLRSKNINAPLQLAENWFSKIKSPHRSQSVSSNAKKSIEQETLTKLSGKKKSQKPESQKQRRKINISSIVVIGTIITLFWIAITWALRNVLTVSVSTVTATTTSTSSTTPTATSTFTPTSSITPTPKYAALVLTGSKCRSGTDQVYQELALIPEGNTIEVVGKNSLNDWLKIKWSDSTSGCWIESRLLFYDFDIALLPVIPTPVPPTSTYQGSYESTPTPLLMTPTGNREIIAVFAPSQVSCSSSECPINVNVTWQNRLHGNKMCVYVQPQETQNQPYFFQFEGTSGTAWIGNAPAGTAFEIIAVSTSLSCGGSSIPPGKSGGARVIRN